MRLAMRWTYASILVFCVVGVATATERKLAKTSLPPAVLKTAEEQSKGATVLGYSSEKEHGQVEYEVQLRLNGHSKDVTISPDGQVMEIEEEVKIEELPAQVKAGLLTQAKKGTISKVESLTKHGAIVAYEAQVVTAGKHSEVQVGPDGKALEYEE
jgi:hypothetical protein